MKKARKCTVSVVSGDIARIPVDALITAINSGGMWFGGIDGVIKRVAGEFFHIQASDAMPLTHGQTVVASSNGYAHRGAFNNVVFVVDDLCGPLHRIVYNGLKAASDMGFKSVSLPTIRMGVMLGVVEKTVHKAVTEMTQGVKEFLAENPESPIENITFVVYNDETTASLLKKALPTK